MRLWSLHHLLFNIVLIVLVVYDQDGIIVLLWHLMACSSRCWVLSLLLRLLSAVVTRCNVDDLLPAALQSNITIVLHLLFILFFLVRIHLGCHIILLFFTHLATFLVFFLLFVFDNVVEGWLRSNLFFIIVITRQCIATDFFSLTLVAWFEDNLLNFFIDQLVLQLRTDHSVISLSNGSGSLNLWCLWLRRSAPIACRTRLALALRSAILLSVDGVLAYLLEGVIVLVLARISIHHIVLWFFKFIISNLGKANKI